MKKVLTDRGSSYSDIEDNSRIFAAEMRAQGVTLPPGMTDVQFHCMAMIKTKEARFASPKADRFHEDTFLDIAGYALLIAAHQRREKARYEEWLTERGLPLPGVAPDWVELENQAAEFQAEEHRSHHTPLGCDELNCPACYPIQLNPEGAE